MSGIIYTTTRFHSSPNSGLPNAFRKAYYALISRPSIRMHGNRTVFNSRIQTDIFKLRTESRGEITRPYHPVLTLLTLARPTLASACVSVARRRSPARAGRETLHTVAEISSIGCSCGEDQRMRRLDMPIERNKYPNLMS